MTRKTSIIFLLCYLFFLTACSQNPNEIPMIIEEIKNTKEKFDWNQLATVDSFGSDYGGRPLGNPSYDELTSPYYKGDYTFEYNGAKFQTVRVAKPYTIEILHNLQSFQYTFSNTKIYEVESAANEKDYYLYTLLNIKSNGNDDVRIHSISKGLFPVCGLQLYLDNGDTLEEKEVLTTISFDYNFKEVLSSGKQQQTYLYIPLDSLKAKNQSITDIDKMDILLSDPRGSIKKFSIQLIPTTE